MNITKLSEEYISENQFIKSALRKGLINYSALARLIAKENNVNNSFDAILIACRRYKKKLTKTSEVDKKVLEILSKSKLEVKNKMVVCVIEKDVYASHLLELHKSIKNTAETFHMIEGTGTITLITTEEFLSAIEKLFKNKIIKVTKQLAEVKLKSPDDLEATPGVIAFLTGLLAEKGINIIETMSAWTDTLFVIEEKDIASVMQVLRF